MDMNWKDTYKFLRLFREEDETIIIGLLHESKTVENTDNYKGVKHFEIPLKQLKKPLNDWVGFGFGSKYFINHYNNKLGKSVYFVVNSGGTKNPDIKDVRSWFIDTDFGKIKEEYSDEKRAVRRMKELEDTNEFESLDIDTYESPKNGLRYVVRGLYNQETIALFKDRFLKKFAWELKDAVIIETYAGFHVYWISKKGQDLSHFKKVQRALVKRFDSDPQIIKESNLMRVPGFYHQKYEEKFLIRVVQWSDRTFSEEELVKTLRLELTDRQSKGFVKREINEKVSYSSDVTRTVTVIQRQQQSDLIFRNVTPFGKMEKLTFSDAHEKLLSEPLSSFVESPAMEQGEMVLCPFHDDNHPSGVVYRSDRGEEVYHCHGCEVGTRNVIGLYILHTGKSWVNAVKDLSKMIGIKVVETEFEREQFEKYRHNRLYFKQDIQTLLPFTSKWIDKFARKIYLRLFNDIGESAVLKEEFQYKGQNVFFVSYRWISKEMNKKNMSSVQNNVILMNVLGFIERVPEEEIPSELRIRAEMERKILQKELSQQGEKGEKRAGNVRLINFYIVHNWNDCAYEIERIARLLHELKFSLTKHNNKLSIENMLGADHAQKVFPDGRKVPKRFTSIVEKIETLIQKEIDKKGYAIAEDILRKLVRIKNKNNELEIVTLKEKEDVFKRHILVNERFKVTKVRSEKKKIELGFKQKNPKTIHVIELN
ncbi:CHC2 zinc finger domain-containing protein (plasmid) [Priestia megaterium]|uniref:CHC2 zinc finger domain-containing protein n=1 Tax=Priestia megaterium TaxID=1404 RepID=UPI0030D58D0F